MLDKIERNDVINARRREDERLRRAKHAAKSAIKQRSAALTQIATAIDWLSDGVSRILKNDAAAAEAAQEAGVEVPNIKGELQKLAQAGANALRPLAALHDGDLTLDSPIGATEEGVVVASTSEIAKRAYEIWESEGCPAGREINHWLRAEAELAAADLLMKRHGDDAVIVAAQHAHECFDRGDVDGQMIWKRILDAVRELQRKLAAGEPCN